MPYEIIDHTADLGIRVTAADVKELFETAARAMFEQMTDVSTVNEAHHRTINISGADVSDLLINWLRELFSIWSVKNGLAARVCIRELTDRKIKGDVFYELYDPDRHDILTDIKAVTYSGISVEHTPAGWQATVIFDI